MAVSIEFRAQGISAIKRTRKPPGRRAFLEFEQMEERTLLAASPIRIGSLGDSLTDEYQFYAPDRTAAQNWVEILSSLRSSQVTFGDFSTTTRGETRNQGYAQNWARSGATATGVDVAGAGTTFLEQYNGNSSTGAPGLLTQPGGLSNVDVVTILIGGNDYESRLSQILNYTITQSDVGSGLSTVIGGQILNALIQVEFDVITGVGNAIDAIRAQNPNIPIILISTPDVGDTPLVVDANATLNTYLPADKQNLLVNTFHAFAGTITTALGSLAAQDKVNFVDLDNLFNSFIANPYVDGIYIDPTAGGPEYTDMFVGDSFHPGTVAQSILANAIIAQLNAIFPNAVQPLSNSEILANAQAVQPVTKLSLTSSTGSTTPGSPITFTAQVMSFPNINSTTTEQNFSTLPPTGTVSFIDVAQGNKILFTTSLRPVGIGPNYTQSVATFTTNSLGQGVHEIVAVYNGDSIYPTATTPTVLEYVGTPKQVKLFSFVTIFQTQLGVQIGEPQLNRWNRRLQNGAPPRHVARSIMRYVYFHTQLPRGQATQLLKETGHANWVRSRS